MCSRLDFDLDDYRHLKYFPSMTIGAFGEGRTDVRPLRLAPLITNPETCRPAVWGWAKADEDGHLLHVDADSIAEHLPGQPSKRGGRGVIAVKGWWEGSVRVEAPDTLIAVLWKATGHHRFVLVTRPAPEAYAGLRTFPVALDEKAALRWLVYGAVDARTPRLTLHHDRMTIAS